MDGSAIFEKVFEIEGTPIVRNDTHFKNLEGLLKSYQKVRQKTE